MCLPTQPDAQVRSIFSILCELLLVFISLVVNQKSPEAGGSKAFVGGADETRARDPMRDRHVF